MRKRFVVAASVLAMTFGVAGAASAAPADEPVLGPQGYKDLFLGQDEAAAEATGLLVGKQPGEGCDFFDLPASEGRPNVGGGVFVEPSKGVVVITGTDKIRTPEGITMGSKLDEVEGAYPELAPVEPYDFVYDTPAPGGQAGERYRFAVDEDGLVADFAVEAADRGTCG